MNIISNSKVSKKNIFQKNIFWLILAFIVIFASVWILYKFDLIDNGTSFLGKSQFDLIIAICFFAGIIGAIWAVWARAEATKAFDQSVRTYNAIANTFTFIKFLDDKDKLFKIINQIDESNSNISLYLGFPSIGYFYEKKKNLKTKPISLLSKLNAKLYEISNNLANNSTMNYSLRIGCFEEKYCKELIKNFKNEESDNISSLIDDFFKYKTAIEGKHKNFQFVPISENEKFRFVTFENEEKEEKNAFIWIVPDLEIIEIEGGKDTKEFDSIVFQTSEGKFIDLLKKVYDTDKPKL